MEIINIDVEVLPGDVIENVIRECQRISKNNGNCLVRFNFNGVKMNTVFGDDIPTLVRIYDFMLHEGD